MTFQVGSTLLDALVLAVIEHGNAYGYALTQRLKTVTDISESTLYPVLRRLSKDGFLDTYDEPFDGRNRRYYRITGKGEGQLTVYRDGWEDYKKRLDGIFFEQYEREDEVDG